MMLSKIDIFFAIEIVFCTTILFIRFVYSFGLVVVFFQINLTYTQNTQTSGRKTQINDATQCEVKYTAHKFRHR